MIWEIRDFCSNRNDSLLKKFSILLKFHRFHILLAFIYFTDCHRKWCSVKLLYIIYSLKKIRPQKHEAKLITLSNTDPMEKFEICPHDLHIPHTVTKRLLWNITAIYPLTKILTFSLVCYFVVKNPVRETQPPTITLELNWTKSTAVPSQRIFLV